MESKVDLETNSGGYGNKDQHKVECAVGSDLARVRDLLGEHEFAAQELVLLLVPDSRVVIRLHHSQAGLLMAALFRVQTQAALTSSTP